MISSTSSKMLIESLIYVEHPEAGVRSAGKNWEKGDSSTSKINKARAKELYQQIYRKLLQSTMYIILQVILRRERLWLKFWSLLKDNFVIQLSAMGLQISQDFTIWTSIFNHSCSSQLSILQLKSSRKVEILWQRSSKDPKFLSSILNSSYISDKFISSSNPTIIQTKQQQRKQC